MKPKWVVCIKQVPREPVFKRTADAYQIDRDRTEGIMNPYDRQAIELALNLKEKQGGEVVVLSMGPSQAEEALREALAFGVDKAVLLSDPEFAGADTLATAYTLASGVRKLGPFSLILCGARTLDSDTAQVGPQTAEKLGVPQITCAERILELADGRVTVRRRIDGGYQVLRSPLPVLLTVIKGAAEPRPFNAQRTMAFKKAMTRAELEKFASDTFGSPRYVAGRHLPDERDEIGRKLRFATRVCFRPLAPEQPEACSVPFQHGVGLHQQQCVTP